MMKPILRPIQSNNLQTGAETEKAPLFDIQIEGFWTSKEAADYLRTTPKQIRNWAYQGKLTYYKLLGRKLLFRKSDLDSLLEKKGGLQ